MTEKGREGVSEEVADPSHEGVEGSEACARNHVEVVRLGHERRKNRPEMSWTREGLQPQRTPQGFEEASDGVCFILFEVPARIAQP